MMNWGDLCGDVLGLILSNLAGEDAHRFSLVCRSWKAVVKASPIYRYTPCLMYYTRSNRLWRFSQFDTCIHMALPHLENADILCSNFGWLLMSRFDNTLFFFDPFHNRKIELPCQLLGHGYTAFCFSHPPTSPDCVVVGFATIDNSDGFVDICVLTHGGEGVWEEMEYHPKIKFLVSRGAPVFHRGLVYLLDVKGNVATFDIKNHGYESAFAVSDPESLELISKGIKEQEIKEHFLFKIRGGEEEALFSVFLVNEERKVQMFRLLEPEMKWEFVEGIGDKVLHLSHYSSSGDTAHLKCMANRIYFPRFHDDTPVFYSFTTGNYHSHDGHFSSANTLGIKRLNFAAWIMPAPSHESSSSEGKLLSWF